MDDISTSFCFICLLHLANERGLSIEVGESSGDAPHAEEGDNVVGDIWGLKVCLHFMTICSEIDVHGL
jgi:condensin complex subunit 2